MTLLTFRFFNVVGGDILSSNPRTIVNVKRDLLGRVEKGIFPRYFRNSRKISEMLSAV